MEEGSLSAAVVEHSQRAAEALCVELAWLELGFGFGYGFGFRVRVRVGLGLGLGCVELAVL